MVGGVTPRAQEIIPVVKTDDTEQKIDCGGIHYVPNFEQPNFVTIAAINTQSNALDTEVVLGNSGVVYASPNNLYFTRQRSDHFWVDGRWQWTDKTDIYKFAMNNGDIAFAARGSVDGTPLNQFSLSEYAGDLRIATTSWREGSQITILDQNMQYLSSIDNIAPGEQIKSARFMGEKGYLVTFENR